MKRFGWLNAWLCLGLAFLYLPIFVLVIYSFNRSTIVTLWGGLSFRWYEVLFHNQLLHKAAWTSIEIGVIASSLSVVLGTLLAFVFKRYGPFKGRTFLYGMTITPLVMPDVITGLSLLLMFVSIQSWFGIFKLGFTTVLIAHATMCAAYATIVIQARFSNLDPCFEEAAMDLGAKPVKTFFWITLPQISSSIVVAWLLSFTLSIDDLVITSFVSGPVTTTLPMYVYASIRNDITPEINALASLLIVMIIGIIGLAAWMFKSWSQSNSLLE